MLQEIEGCKTKHQENPAACKPGFGFNHGENQLRTQHHPDHHIYQMNPKKRDKLIAAQRKEKPQQQIVAAKRRKMDESSAQ